MNLIDNKLVNTILSNTPGALNAARYAGILKDISALETNSVLEKFNVTLAGLPEEQVEIRGKEFGPNEVAKEKKKKPLMRLWSNIKNPLVLLLMGLAAISYFTGDIRATLVISSMVILGVVLQFVQESRADNAAEQLQAMVSTTATVIRDNKRQEIPLKELVPGDIVTLAAGDMVPADVRMLSTKDLFVNQSSLTGESVPVEKFSVKSEAGAGNPLELSNIGFLGSDVESGSGTAIVLFTGRNTYFGSLASSITGEREITSFDKGINQFTWLMIQFMIVMVPLVFLFNGLSKGNWMEAFLFALAVAVGLTPEMLPMIVTVNLSKGALAMSKKKVIVKRLNAIQNFGAMDTLCTDKTGTITQGKIVLEKHLDVRGNPSAKVLHYGYINSYFQTGLKNLLDVAVLNHVDLQEQIVLKGDYQLLDEIPFDFSRRRMSVVVEDHEDDHILICKGAVEEIMGLCSHVEMDGEVLEVLPEYDLKRRKLVQDLNAQGFRVIAIAYKMVEKEVHDKIYSVKDETDLTLLGFLAFLDPPKQDAAKALSLLEANNIKVKILTGDNDTVTISICHQVNLPVESILLGSEIDEIDDKTLAARAENATIFAKLSPNHKQRIIRALQQDGHVVGFMGDGINDAPALKAADVGISVDTAVDIAKESSDIILLETSLLVLEEGVLEGRRVFGNIIKYIKMAASSNFGNMFSVLGGSIFLPFLPMLPIQVLTNNLLYDFSQTAIPTDEVDKEWLARPRKWTIGEIRRFIFFIGPISSIFDYLTFFLMLYVFNAWNNPALFHTGWFVESLVSQTLIIHVIRTNRIPFIQSRASWPLIITSIIILGIGIGLTFSPLAGALGFVALPSTYWLYLAGMIVAYILLTQVIKTWFFQRFGD
ncbi:magnesium-translocating P-type ATPase [Leptolinea tardivitalis]|uniref:magnesium-translocating P-type ATPase n=1 Tax=Leptolinea tardivitalis TaxID=229920 RepID=UPI0009D715F4|nr:magnesium-translocating P-type ATPase [Leptolinea tardivitalis]GAP22092.1 magnesium-translocating P-type ATPase [Leptolinea tardivitalis]